MKTKMLKSLIFFFLIFKSCYAFQNFSIEEESQKIYGIAQQFAHLIFQEDFEKLEQEKLKILSQKIIEHYEQFYSEEDFWTDDQWSPTDTETLEITKTRKSKKILQLLCCIKQDLENLNVNCDFDPIINLINECCTQIQNQITNLQININQNFNNTFTVLADIKNTITECCADLHDLIESLSSGITFTVFQFVSGDFTTIFTVLADIKLTLTECCAQNQRNFNNTFTVLSDIKNTITACCAQNQTNFNNTFTVLADIKETLTECCAAIQNNFCNPTFISNADLGATGYNINTGSLYKLAEDIVYFPAAPSNAININASGATLDLQCFSLSQGNLVPNVNGIFVSPNLSDVTIENGMIKRFSRAGISVQSGNTRLLVDNVETFSCDVRGTEFQGTVATPVTESLIKDCTLTNCCRGATGDFVISYSVCNRCNIYNTKLNSNGISTHSLSVVRMTDCITCKANKVKTKNNTGTSTVSFDLQTTSTSILKRCSSRTDNSTTGNYTGILLSNNCSANEFTRCKAIANIGGTTCFGFRITGTQSLANIISDSLISRNIANNGDMAGIQIDAANRGTIVSTIVENNRSVTTRGMGLNVISPGTEWEVKRSQFIRNTGSVTAGTSSNSFGILDPGASTSVNLYSHNYAFLNGTLANNQYAIATNTSMAGGIVDSGTTTGLPAFSWANLRVVT
ncbi:hypothetical protein M1446_02250 [Candidatus Dependentiae bacterium]|nr:hypothetical protein [Candidatus Dependentiae bacterium]